MRFSNRLAVVVAATVASLAVFAGAATAVATYRIGGTTTRQYFASSDQPVMVPGPNTWQVVPYTGIVAVTTTRTILDARFSAESLCQGSSGWCSVRVIYSNNNGPWTELAPASGTDYAFDSDGGLWDQHTVERSSALYLPAGTTRVWVQAMRVGSTTFRLDDYHLAVGFVQP